MQTPDKVYYCYVSGLPIPPTRVEALISLGVPEDRWTVVKHSQTTKKQGVYFGEYGSGELKIVDKVYEYDKKIFTESDEESDEVEKPN